MSGRRHESACLINASIGFVLNHDFVFLFLKSILCILIGPGSLVLFSSWFTHCKWSHHSWEYSGISRHIIMDIYFLALMLWMIYIFHISYHWFTLDLSLITFHDRDDSCSLHLNSLEFHHESQTKQSIPSVAPHRLKISMMYVKRSQSSCLQFKWRIRMTRVLHIDIIYCI